MTPYEAFGEAIDQIPEVAAGLVEIGICEDTDRGGAELGCLWSHVERGKGHAGSAMRALLLLADEHGIDLYGEPCFLRYDVASMEMDGEPEEEIDRLDGLNKQGLDNSQLLDWYLRLGFETNGIMRGDCPETVRMAGTPIPRI